MRNSSHRTYDLVCVRMIENIAELCTTLAGLNTATLAITENTDTLREISRFKVFCEAEWLAHRT